jgi:putative membrane protein (TIGR04086 family)
MKYLKNFLHALIYTFSTLLILTFIFTLLSFFNVINFNGTIITKFIISFIAIFIGGFILGKNSLKKGWLEGLKFGSLIIFIFLLFNLLIIKSPFKITLLLYYLGILCTASFGSMIGIFRKR